MALVGAPNTGKTTLYNWLTGSRFKTVNYPGATVEYAIGDLVAHLREDGENSPFRLIDTPGVYGLNPKSADEEVTVKALFQLPGLGAVDGVLVVVDGTQLERHLHLALEVKNAGFPFVVAVTMADLLRREGLELDLAALSKSLGAPVVSFEGLLGGGLREIVTGLRALPARGEVRAPEVKIEVAQRQARELATLALSRVDRPQERLRRVTENTRRLDAVLLHPILGPALFFLIMAALFSSIYWMAAPFMDFIDGGFSSLAAWAHGEGEVGPLRDFVANGVIASFGAVLVFVPQIFILFVGIGLLESTGYLARAATLIDRPFSKLGLTGRSFVPILSGFSCAVPALIATRNISSRRDRWITNFVIPLMTCSARLPVYALLLGFVFADQPAFVAGLALAGLYFGAMLIGALAAAILNQLIPKDAASILMMELPLYRRPRVRVVLRQSLTRTWAYARRAGPIILTIAILMWVGTNFPNYNMEDPTEKLAQSYAGRIGQWIEPVVEPMGVDWRVGVGLMSAFAAREVFVSTLAVAFHVTAEDEDGQAESLIKQMETATRASDGAKIFTPATVAGLIVFFMIALQCMTTFAVAQRESGSWKFAFGQLVIFNIVAYVLAILTVHGLRLIGFE
ncbi:MAG: ferrous iron transporter B [Bdellovibrionaceae bacterium]|nr:ferrous iron transporter B [Pseudobdellovibrionaceae bacterium]